MVRVVKGCMRFRVPLGRFGVSLGHIHARRRGCQGGCAACACGAYGGTGKTDAREEISLGLASKISPPEKRGYISPAKLTLQTQCGHANVTEIGNLGNLLESILEIVKALSLPVVLAIIVTFVLFRSTQPQPL